MNWCKKLTRDLFCCCSCYTTWHILSIYSFLLLHSIIHEKYVFNVVDENLRVSSSPERKVPSKKTKPSRRPSDPLFLCHWRWWMMIGVMVTVTCIFLLWFRRIVVLLFPPQLLPNSFISSSSRVSRLLVVIWCDDELD